MPESVAVVPDIQPRAVLDYWFYDQGELASVETLNKRWFGMGDTLDAEIRQQFGMALEKAVAGGLRDWEADSESRLALIVVLDQFTRQAWRGSVRAFVGDQRALRLSKSGFKRGYFNDLPLMMKVAALMPYEHSEALADQIECVDRFRSLAVEYPAHQSTLAGFVRFAEMHYEIIEEFGRFPHRNQVMGRASTQAELEYLESGMRFGQ
ncbi:MAG: DUF924 family protein [Litorivicinus sp.]